MGELAGVKLRKQEEEEEEEEEEQEEGAFGRLNFYVLSGAEQTEPRV